MISSPTVADRQVSSKHAFPAEDEPRGWRALFGRPRRGARPGPAPAMRRGARDDADTKAMPRVGSVTGEVPVHRSHGTEPDLVLHNMLAVIADALRHGWSSTRAEQALGPHWAELRKRAGLERSAVETVARRHERDAAEAARMAKALEYADSLGGLDGVDPARLAATMVSRSVHATDPSRPTGLLPVITPDMPDPRTAVELELAESGPDHAVFRVVSGVPSPVHADGAAAPVPVGEPVETDELPRREPKATAAEAERFEGGASA